MSSRTLAAAGACWLLIVGAGLRTLWVYELTPTAAARAPVTWPAATSLPRPPDRPALVMFLHPRCPSSRASLAELKDLLQATPDPVAVTVVFVRPDDTEAGWERTDLWAEALRLSGATTWTDTGGVEAERFDARTSGQTFLYDRGGQLLFSGGVTRARGERGKSAGALRLRALIEGRTPDSANAKVFGCALLGDG